MPARVSISRLWEKNKRDSANFGKSRRSILTRAEELAAIERFAAERGVTRATEPPRDEWVPAPEGRPNPTPDWRG